MAIYGVSITKSTTFRGAAQEFGNTYYYNLTVGTVSQATAEALIDALVTKEKTMHSTSITFVRAKCWSAGGTNAENQMIFQKNLSGTGSNTANSAGMDKERAILVRFRAGQDSKGRPVYLRKWWHFDAAAIGADSYTSAMLANTAQLTSTMRTNHEANADFFKSVTANTFTFTLVSEKGRTISGATQCHPYLEHHQLGEMWR